MVHSPSPNAAAKLVLNMVADTQDMLLYPCLSSQGGRHLLARSFHYTKQDC